LAAKSVPALKSLQERRADDYDDKDNESRDVRLLQSAIYWLEWNKLVDRNYPNGTLIRTEDVNPKELVLGLGSFAVEHVGGMLAVQQLLPDSLPHEHRTMNKSPESSKNELTNVTWSMIYTLDSELCQRIFDLAQSYGYEAGKKLDQVVDIASLGSAKTFS
jgi:hypothetical protein